MTDDAGRSETRTVETWRTTELVLTAAEAHVDPLAVQVDAVFTAQDGTEIRRPAFWDGGRRWLVRFAPPAVGTWRMRTVSEVADAGLDRAQAEIVCVPYSGAHEIFRRGFLRVSANGRHFEYADSTPFFYLGDTHWVLPHERFDDSNASGAPSQFQYLVELRAEQGFTVYQSEPIWQPHTPGTRHDRADESPVADLTNGFDESDLPGFADLDRKFAHIADQGLVHANAQITWVLDPASHPDVFDERFMYRMARYWVARYGSYPVIWTIAQEIDPTMYGAYPPDDGNVWFAVGRAIEANDAYGHVIMPHMENTGDVVASDSTWRSHSFHHAFGVQVDTWNSAAVRTFWDETPAKPAVLYETRYDGFWTDDDGALAAGYRSFQLGLLGYGYGAAGIWNDVYSAPGEPLDAGTDYELPERYVWWFDGAKKPAGERLGHFRRFYEQQQWWTLEPRFSDRRWSVLRDGDQLATRSNDLYVVFLAHPSRMGGNGVLRNLAPAQYEGFWFDPRTGESTSFGGPGPHNGGAWRLPPAPTEDFLMAVLRRTPLPSR
jgi:hypothetical protein